MAKTECVQRLYENSVFIKTSGHSEPVLKLEPRYVDVGASLAGSDQSQTTQQPQPGYHQLVSKFGIKPGQKRLEEKPV